ncbi:MAG TPA: ribosomal protein S18-alanine N-acetyltransferase [Bryobacteraceae bacterium]|nr:ribosomal protein S18-alanine N-acetyltransferase [Bryobacteraceae bacterium]
MILIRQAGARDFRRILEIENASFGTDAWDREIFLAYLRDYPDLFFVARLGRRICGYAVTCMDRTSAELASIAVDPDFRGHGVGRSLLRHTASRLRRGGMDRWWLTVRTGNETAIAFYCRFGFTRVRRVRGYYEDGEDGWRMQRKP